MSGLLTLHRKSWMVLQHLMRCSQNLQPDSESSRGYRRRSSVELIHDAFDNTLFLQTPDQNIITNTIVCAVRLTHEAFFAGKTFTKYSGLRVGLKRCD